MDEAKIGNQGSIDYRSGKVADEAKVKWMRSQSA